MPLLTTKIEGKGNGIKTVVPNMADVARALSRPPTYPTKFFGCELGAQTSFDEKNERYIVNGAHNADRLRELLDQFIEKFVLCKSCKNPETDLVIIKNGRTEVIIRDCKACGERTDIDMRHKLITFILKNPPVKTKKDKKQNAGTAAASVGGSTSPTENRDGEVADGAPGADSDDELTKKIKAEAAELNPETTIAGEDWAADLQKPLNNVWKFWRVIWRQSPLLGMTKVVMRMSIAPILSLASGLKKVGMRSMIVRPLLSRSLKRFRNWASKRNTRPS